MAILLVKNIFKVFEALFIYFLRLKQNLLYILLFDRILLVFYSAKYLLIFLRPLVNK